MYKGIGASAGIGIGKIVKIKEEELNYTKQSIEDTEAEKKRLSDAIEVFIEKTQKMVESMKVTAGEQEAEILEGHIMMIQDPAISEQIEAKIDGEKINAEAAVEEACDFFAQIFAMADDELTQQRASDLGDIKTRLIKILLGIEEVDISAVPEGTILVYPQASLQSGRWCPHRPGRAGAGVPPLTLDKNNPQAAPGCPRNR